MKTFLWSLMQSGPNHENQLTNSFGMDNANNEMEMRGRITDHYLKADPDKSIRALYIREVSKEIMLRLGYTKITP